MYVLIVVLVVVGFYAFLLLTSLTADIAGRIYDLDQSPIHTVTTS